jgi:putative transposase
MRKSKFTDSQIMDAVKRVEAGFAVPDICEFTPCSMARLRPFGIALL